MRGPHSLRLADIVALAGFAAACAGGCTTSEPKRDPGGCVWAAAPSAYSGCNPELGVECDGDYRDVSLSPEVGLCSPECPESQCCSPQGGRFTCVDRDEAGRCPAPDLFVDAPRTEETYTLEYRTFEEGDCALVEGCVGGPGRRRLLRFDTWTPNIGTADVFLGDPDRASSYFEQSECHDHAHFETYAEYELLTADGACMVAAGHKQAFCLLDSYRYPGADQEGAVYDCAFQGIQRGWQDVYRRELDCQWVDVTDVPEGEYLLRIRLNTEHILNESNYENNEALVPITITDEA